MDDDTLTFSVAHYLTSPTHSTPYISNGWESLAGARPTLNT